ncbi:restriction endonuclease subunit S [Rhizobium rhizophilum]|uniref:Type I restriction modification DNA specificity domain-containing protein n=1 Tax=Rhizobium rhizophilum TaxID=1850373 RepID=A0ABY2QYP5_9HYPH|nr:restriction endonuclease subunit S [Rhizobium rhizophilum]THV16725.1 hypothetical protein E9677_01600 [Rhizobium rhizophilum]
MLREVPEGWRAGKFDTFITLQRGFDLPVQDRRQGTFAVIASNGQIDSHSEPRIPGPSVITGRSGTLGKVFHISEGCWPLNTTLYVKDFHGNDPEFVACFLKHFKLDRFGTGTGVPTLNRNVVHEVEVALPPLQEQRRIAEILASVDEAIASMCAVIEQTRKLKQGVLERLLTKGIDHTCFKQTDIGEIPEGWEVAQVGQFARLQPGYAFKSAEFTESGIKLLRGSNVGVGSFDWSEGVTKCFPAERVDEFSEYLLGENDIIIAMDRPFISAGFKVARLRKSDLPCLLLQRVGRLTPTGDCDPDWLWQITSAGSVRRHLEKQQVGTDLPHISRSDIESCTVALPPLAEQRAIAAILKPLDTQADLLMQSLSSGERLKSALMSDLLTGRKRVTDALPMAAE